MVTEARRRQLHARLSDVGGLQAFMLALSAIPADDYLMGRKDAAVGRRRFRLTLDYLLRTGSGTGDTLASLLDAARDAEAKSAAAAAPPPTAPAPCDEPTRRVHARLRAQHGDEVYGSWFRHLHVESLEGGTVRTSLPTKFLQTWIQGRYADSLLECCKAEFVGARRVEILVRAAP
jgi:hypothetical protein